MKYYLACRHFGVTVRKGQKPIITFLCYYGSSKNKVLNLNYSTSEKIGITRVPDVLLYCLIVK